MQEINYMHYIFAILFAVVSSAVITLILGNNIRNEKRIKEQIDSDDLESDLAPDLKSDLEEDIFSETKEDLKSKNEKIESSEDKQNIFKNISEGLSKENLSKNFNIIIRIFKDNIFTFIGFGLVLLLINLSYTNSLASHESFSKFEVIVLWIEKIIVVPIIMLILAYDILKKRIPNRYSITLLEIALVSTIILGSINIAYLKERFVGLLIAAIMLIIMYVAGRLIFGRDSIGLGDVKALIPLGAIFGAITFIDILVISYGLIIIASIIVTIYGAIRRKKITYVPFMPFLLVAILVSMYVKPGSITEFTSSMLGGII